MDSKRPRPKNALRHGFRVGDHGSGNKQHPLYTCWLNLRARCDNPKRKEYPNYGGRGIYYSPRWTSFEVFAADMGERPADASIDRIDTNGPYYKENCRWVTKEEQNRNKRNNIRIEFNGKSQTVTEWSRELGIGRTTLQSRLKRNVPIEVAFSS